VNRVYIARCCALFTLAHKTELSTVSCGSGKQKPKLKKRSTRSMATKKGGKKAAKKGGAKKGAKKGGTKKAAKKR
jgi:hypothetical protein